MKRRNIFAITSVLIVGLKSSCVSNSSKNTTNQNSNSAFADVGNRNASASVVKEDPESLCKRLHELKRMPFEEEKSGDPVYDGLLASGRAAIPGLVDKITDTTIMADPRESPHVHGFMVGDAAVFMLHDITREPLESILPAAVAEEWKTEGVYAYFSYVENFKNRKKVQKWWKDWMSKNLKQ